MHKNLFILLGLLLPITSFNAFAADDALTLYGRAQEEFAKRSSDVTPTVGAVADLTKALDIVGDNADLKYKILILAARSAYWNGMHATEKDLKMSTLEQAMKFAETAKQANASYADAYYYYAISLGRWAEAKGVVESLGRKKELFQNVDAAIAATAMDGSAGRAIDGYGPLRTSGRVYFKLPGFAGGSQKKAYELHKEAFDKAPNVMLNVTYFAETLNAGNSEQQAQACTILNDAVKKANADIVAFQPDRVPETRDELETANQLIRDLCN